jgi:hypothetical protein
MRVVVLLLFPAYLAACQTQQQRCEARAVEELRTVNALIAETEATMERGFAYQTVQNAGSAVTFCWGSYSGYWGDGWGGGGGVCWGNGAYTTEQPVAVDLDEQRATLRSLQAKRKELEGQARVQLAACASSAAPD